ncbi:MAG: ATP-binding protein [Burkholderiaceae bacterium]
MSAADPQRLPAAAPPPPPGIDELAVYRSLFSAYPDGLLMVDPHGTIVLANPAARLLFDYPGDTLIGRQVDDLVPDSMRPRHAAYRNAYGKAPTSRPMGARIDLRARRRDGSEVTVEISLSPLRTDGATSGPPYTVAAIRAVDDYPRVKQALQRARFAECVAQLGRLAVNAREPQGLLDQVPAAVADTLQLETAAIVVFESHLSRLRVLAARGLSEAITTLPCDDVAGTLIGHVMAAGEPVRIADLAQEHSVPLAPQALTRGLSSLLAVPLSDRGRPSGALIVASRSLRAFSDEAAQFLDSVGSIVTTALQRVRTEEALNHSQRLDSVGQLTGGIAHDFNNLLTVISGNLQVLQEMPACTEDAASQPLVDAAIRATRRGAELTGKLLAFARRQRLQPTIVDVAELLASLTDMLRRTLDPRIDIRLDAEPCSCRVDAGQLESALLNIALNARDAMQDGGTLSFACRTSATLPDELRDAEDADRSRIDSEDAADRPRLDGPAAPRRYVAISVSDTGTGMTEAVRERAFEPFFTTKTHGRGTGLGLSTVYGFARQSDGTAAIASTPGGGTTVTLYLPESLDPSTMHPTAAGCARLPARMPVLLVEDDADVRVATRNLLAAMGCEVTECPNAESALDLLSNAQRQGRPYRLLLTDIALGAGGSGLDLARHAQRHLPSLSVVVMSGFPDQTPGAASDAPLLRKPFTRAELAAAMMRSLQSASDRRPD